MGFLKLTPVWGKHRYKYILDKVLLKVLGSNYAKVKGYYVAGGAVRSAFAGEKIKDLDIYFLSTSDWEKRKEFANFKNMKFLFGTEFAETYETEGVPVQFIKRFYGEPERVMSEFDFTISMAAYLPEREEFCLGEDFLHHLCERRLVFNENTRFPVSSLWRVKKFLKRGYKIGARDIIVLALAVHNLKIETFRDLKEQLDGIDTWLLKDITDKMIEDKGEAEYDLVEFIAYIDEKIADLWGRVEEED